MNRFSNNRVTITKEILEKKIQCMGIGIKKEQCKILQIPYPLKSGWKTEVIGKTVSEVEFQKLRSLQHSKKKALPKSKTFRLSIRITGSVEVIETREITLTDYNQLGFNSPKMRAKVEEWKNEMINDIITADLTEI